MTYNENFKSKLSLILERASLSLFGIETEDDCRQRLDELLELHSLAKKTPTKETVATLKSALNSLYNAGNSSKATRQMSLVEYRSFWPAIQKAFVQAPNLNDRSTWNDGLYDIQENLQYYRP